MSKFFKIFLFIIITSLCSACTTKLDINLNKNNSAPVENQQIPIEDILKGEKLVAIVNKDQLYLVDPEFAYPLPIYTFKDKEKPTSISINDFYISPSHKWLAWYSPHKGVIALNIKEGKTKIIEAANDFLNTNPYLNFHKELDYLRYITSQGSSLKIVDLNTDNVDEINIPYPYGNIFQISPDENSILFISGYGQSQNQPKYMFTDQNGDQASQFTTETNIADRHLVTWAPDSTGIIMPVANKLVYYPKDNPKNFKILYETKNEQDSFINLSRINDLIFAQSNRGYWHVYSYTQQKETARTPTSIANDLNKPHFTPWSKNEYLIEEKLSDNGIDFNRMWLSDFKGVKKIVVAKYNEVIVNTQLDNLE